MIEFYEDDPFQMEIPGEFTPMVSSKKLNIGRKNRFTGDALPPFAHNI
ncbi:MAG: hypothetical protein PHC60_00425 [Heliobacteriaceae bacterium]|nr:hypothetical protein [Heliobacteriaceae bacterium]MDD4586845.1 hypothetical protein [Heliobacteriaceae bacterium]